MSKYTAGIAERARAASEKDRVKIPDFSAAASQYRPEKDGPMTLTAIAQAQENISNMSITDEKPSLKPETIQGLRALSEQVAAQQGPPMAPPAAAAPAAEAPKEEKKSFSKLSEDEKRQAAETADIDFDLMMQRLRNDVVNNDEERKAIEEKLHPMDLADGLANGEFRQFVPISKGKLEVVFRSVSPMENEEIRRKILEEVISDERFSSMASERYGFWQMVASVHSINGQEMPRHSEPAPKGAGRVFLWNTFTNKVNLFMSYPGPLIHALSTHAYWFDLRVRKLFTNVALKNG